MLGLLQCAQQYRYHWDAQENAPSRREIMEMTIDLQGPEAALLLAASVSLADDNPSETEEIILKKYFSAATADSLESKLQASEIPYPQALEEMEDHIIQSLKQESLLFQKRSLAVCLELSMADGTIDQQEMLLLNRYCSFFGISLHEVDLFREKKLQELNEEGDYYHMEDLTDEERPLTIDLSPKEAALSLLTLTAFADDDPSEKETALIREYFSLEDIQLLMNRFEKAGASFPEDLPRCIDSIMTTMKELNRQEQLKYLTLLYKTASADGKMDEREQHIIEQFCTELTIGPGELKQCSPLLESLFRS